MAHLLGPCGTNYHDPFRFYKDSDLGNSHFREILKVREIAYYNENQNGFFAFKQ